MLGLYFSFTIAASYFLCVFGQTEESCMDQVMAQCNHDIFQGEFPTTVDQLKSICRDLNVLGGCILNVQESCHDSNNLTRRFRDMFSYIHDVCREDSEIFQVISSNLECIASAGGNAFQSCRNFEFTDSTKELILNTVQEYAEKSQKELTDEENWCIHALWKASCPSVKIGVKCGSEVGVTVKDILNHVNPDMMCSDEFVAEVSLVMEIIELAVVQEELLKKMEEEEESPAEETRRKRRFASPFHAFIDFY